MTPAQGRPAMRSGPALEYASAVLAALAILLTLSLSGLMLARFGIAYEEAGGPAWQKVHIAVPVAFAALSALALSRGNPFWLIDDVIRRQPGAMAFIAMLFVMVAYVMWRVGGPITQFIDTFVLPWMIFLILLRWPEDWLRPMAKLFHGFMVLNALMGLAEFAFGFRITPLVAEGQVITTEWRSTALLGHPLLNAAATACYAFMLLIGGGRDLPAWARAAAFALQTSAMIVFGGRAATAFLLLFAVPTLIAAAWRFRGSYKLTPASAALLILTGVAAAAGIAGLAEGGFFDKFIGRFLDDGGSAAARTSMFDVLWALSPEMLWLGSDPDYIASLQRQVGIPFGIESFWIAMIANQGLLFSVPFFVLFLLYLNEYRRALIPGTIWSLLLFLLIISASTSLSSKTAMLTIYTIAACLLLRPPAPERR